MIDAFGQCPQFGDSRADLLAQQHAAATGFGSLANHHFNRIGLPQVSYVASLTQTDRHYEQIIESLKPQGRLGLIDDPATLDVVPLKRKSLSLHWELMYTRSLYETEDMQEQHNILNEVARQIDAGVLRTTVGENYGRISAENLRRAHALLESGKAKGKIVLEGF